MGKDAKQRVFALGSKDESGGNQTCTASLQSNEKLSLRLRLPQDLQAIQGKRLKIEEVAFNNGQAAILAALNYPEGQAISYRFKKDKTSWRVFASTTLKKVARISVEGNGAIGIDLNADHVAFVETDRFGNPISKKILIKLSRNSS